MATNYTWTVNEMLVEDMDGLQDFVVTALFNVVGVDDTDPEATGTVTGSEVFEFTEGSEFTAFADLTNDQVVGWIKEKMGEEMVATVEANIQAQIDAVLNPPVVPVVKPLPW